MRRTGRPGRAARARVRAGGKLAVGRASASLAEWRETKQAVFEREGGRCQWSGRPGTDYHHVVKRSAGGSDHPDNVVLLARKAHDRTDWPYAKGRLVVTALGGGRFKLEVLFARPDD